jgi:hypothetical protein
MIVNSSVQIVTKTVHDHELPSQGPAAGRPAPTAGPRGSAGFPEPASGTAPSRRQARLRAGVRYGSEPASGTAPGQFPLGLERAVVAGEE